MIDYLAPVRERYEDLRADEAALEAMLAGGAARARAIAAPTLADVRERMGVGAARGRPSCVTGTVDHERGASAIEEGRRVDSIGQAHGAEVRA